MADAAHEWLVLEAVQARLQGIARASGYRTDAGADVRLEPVQSVDLTAPRLTVYSGGTTPGEARNERDFTLIVEFVMPVDWDNAHHETVAIAADIEDALTRDRLALPMALPLEFGETLYFDRPDGMPVVGGQSLYRTRYRR